MRILGLLEVSDFARSHPQETEVLGAWVHEVLHRKWLNSDALMAEYRLAEVEQPPHVVFRLGRSPVIVETTVDYRLGVILVERLTLLTPVRR